MPNPIRFARVVRTPVLAKSIPFYVDFSKLPDGAMPSRFGNVPTWSVVDGKAICVPNESAEISPTNMDFEQAPNSGWSASNVSAVGSADARPGSLGVQSWCMTASAANGSFSKTWAGTLLDFCRWKTWCKAGTSNAQLRINGGAANGKVVSSTAWAEYTVPGFRITGGSLYLNTRVVTSGGTAYYDDGSWVELEGVMAGVEIPVGNLAVRANVHSSVASEVVGLHGVFFSSSRSRFDDASVNGIFVYIVTGDSSAAAVARACKVVNGVGLLQGSLTTVAFVDGASLELRRIDATTYRAYYNNIQVGTDITVTEPEIQNAKYAGIISTGGAGQGIDAFFLF